MNKNTKFSIVPQPKRAYKTPKLKELGSVQKLTLKGGSNMDSFGGTFG
ncbi:lasso RiPP family leader peptide-containing protein [Spirosoma areae]